RADEVGGAGCDGDRAQEHGPLDSGGEHRGDDRRADKVPLNRPRIERTKTKPMILNALTVVHVVLSLIGIGSGVVAIYGLLKAKNPGRWTQAFLVTTGGLGPP